MKYLKIVAGLAVSAAALYFSFRNIDLAEVLRVIGRANPWFLAASVALGLGAFALRCLRWKIIGREQYAAVPWLVFLKATSMGLMLNTFVPMRGGDIFQAYVLGKKAGVSKSYALSTVIIERLVDLVPPVVIIIVSSVFIALPDVITLPRILAFVGAGFAALGAVVFFGKKFAGIFDRFLAAHHSDKLKKLMDNFLAAMELMKEPATIFKVTALTAVFWSMVCVSVYLMLPALGINLPFFAAFTIQAVTMISVAIPSSPGYVGIWEFFAILALGIFGVAGPLAAGFAVVHHFLSLLPVTLLGLYFLVGDIQSYRAASKE